MNSETEQSHLEMPRLQVGKSVPSIAGEHSASVDGTDNPILARAKEILARQPTTAEIEEDEARRQRNRIDRIMAPQEQPLVYKVNKDALIKSVTAFARVHSKPSWLTANG